MSLRASAEKNWNHISIEFNFLNPSPFFFYLESFEESTSGLRLHFTQLCLLVTGSCRIYLAKMVKTQSLIVGMVLSKGSLEVFECEVEAVFGGCTLTRPRSCLAGAGTFYDTDTSGSVSGHHPVEKHFRKVMVLEITLAQGTEGGETPCEE